MFQNASSHPHLKAYFVVVGGGGGGGSEKEGGRWGGGSLTPIMTAWSSRLGQMSMSDTTNRLMA